MLKNVAPVYPDAVEALRESSFEFFLTGSRFFEDKNPNDWDFYVQDDGFSAGMPEYNHLRDFLVMAGFRKIPFSPYTNDPNVAEVWAHLPLPLEEYMDNYEAYGHDPSVANILQNSADVHVQIVEDINARHVINQTILRYLHFSYLKMAKTERHWLYEALYRVYQAGKENHLNA